jgi:hypothetical protein
MMGVLAEQPQYLVNGQMGFPSFLHPWR